ncbi:MAG: ferrous iron transport protein A [Erysipelotrichaceae bacterium]|nr:ferrous iron transport protein A [Erysipelotrichaceae bacterium]
MLLNELKIGETGKISVVGGNGPLRQHFLDMGLIPGGEITLVKYAPLGDPIEFRIHGYELTLRVDEARLIEIEKADKKTKKKTRLQKEMRNIRVLVKMVSIMICRK